MLLVFKPLCSSCYSTYVRHGASQPTSFSGAELLHLRTGPHADFSGHKKAAGSMIPHSLWYKKAVGVDHPSPTAWKLVVAEVSG
jgi:hypothetical protein